MHDEQGNPIDPTLIPLVEKLREQDECVWLCAPEFEGTVTILFMPRQELAGVKQAQERGLHFGFGRSFEVRLNGTDWEIVNDGSWIS
jgi:hypothetical protein